MMKLKSVYDVVWTAFVCVVIGLIILLIVLLISSIANAEYYVLYKAKLSLFWQPSENTKYYKVMIEPLGAPASLVCYTRHPSVVVTLPKGKTVRYYTVPLDRVNHAWPSKRSPYSAYYSYIERSSK